MYTVAEIVVLSRAYMDATAVQVTRLSTAATGNSKTIGRLLEGEDCTAGSIERASIWFPANWPLHVPWPEAVPRPLGRWRLELRLHGQPPPRELNGNEGVVGPRALSAIPLGECR